MLNFSHVNELIAARPPTLAREFDERALIKLMNDIAKLLMIWHAEREGSA